MIKERADGKWLAKCDVCTWRTLESESSKAQQKLSRHIAVAHRRDRRSIKKRQRPIPPRVRNRRIRGI